MDDEALEPAENLTGTCRETDGPAARLVGQANGCANRDSRVERERGLGSHARQQPELGAERRAAAANRTRHPCAKSDAGGVRRGQHVAEAEAERCPPTVAGWQLRADADNGVGRRGRNVATSLDAELKLAAPEAGNNRIGLGLDPRHVGVGRVLTGFDTGCPGLDACQTAVVRLDLGLDLGDLHNQTIQCLNRVLAHAAEILHLRDQRLDVGAISLDSQLELVEPTLDEAVNGRVVVDGVPNIGHLLRRRHLVGVGLVGHLLLQVLQSHVDGRHLAVEDVLNLGQRGLVVGRTHVRRDDGRREQNSQEHGGHEGQKGLLHLQYLPPSRGFSRP